VLFYKHEYILESALKVLKSKLLKNKIPGVMPKHGFVLLNNLSNFVRT